MMRSGETIGWWGCVSCGEVVRNSHTGPCEICGGDIGRVVPRGMELDIDLGLAPLLERRVSDVEPAKSHGNYIALVAGAVLCIASPFLGASTAGWNAVAIVMALNIWSYSVGYYALALVRSSDTPGGGYA